jgi:hypothetical protein
MRKIILHLLLICFIFSSESNALDVGYVDSTSYSNDKFCFLNFSLNGEIKKNDAQKFINIFNSQLQNFKNKGCPSSSPIVTIDSIGGDIMEAIELGRFFKKNQMAVYVSLTYNEFKKNNYEPNIFKKGRCYSACVFLLAGGVVRKIDTTFSEVGIHRPHFLEIQAETTAAEMKSVRTKLNGLIREYFEEVDINPSLLDDMLSVPPDQIRILTTSELERYRLSVDDANYDEVKTAKNAKLWGLSISEYRTRVQMGDAKCSRINRSPEEDELCRHSILLGISPPEREARVAKAKRLCHPINDETQKNRCVTDIYILGK